MSERELDAVETRFDFTVSADHRVFLSAGLPNGPDPERAELAEREDPVREAIQDVLDSVELGVVPRSPHTVHRPAAPGDRVVGHLARRITPLSPDPDRQVGC